MVVGASTEADKDAANCQRAKIQTEIEENSEQTGYPTTKGSSSQVLFMHQLIVILSNAALNMDQTSFIQPTPTYSGEDVSQYQTHGSDGATKPP